MMHAYFFSLTFILDSENARFPVLVTGRITADIEDENNQ